MSKRARARRAALKVKKIVRPKKKVIIEEIEEIEEVEEVKKTSFYTRTEPTDAWKDKYK